MTRNTANINPAEVAGFDALADEWWDPNGRLRTLHVINPLRLKYIGERADGLGGKRVLDLGCGGGILSEAMAEAGAMVTGLDASGKAIAAAAAHQARKDLHIDYVHGTAEALAEAGPEKFDAVTCMEMLEHVPDPFAVVEAAASLLRPGGHAFFATINRNLKSWLTAVVGAEHVLKLLPAGTHHYAEFIRPSELCGWLREAGFTVEDLTGVKYLPFANRAFLHGDPSVNYMVHARLRA